MDVRYKLCKMIDECYNVFLFASYSICDNHPLLDKYLLIDIYLLFDSNYPYSNYCFFFFSRTIIFVDKRNDRSE